MRMERNYHEEYQDIIPCDKDGQIILDIAPDSAGSLFLQVGKGPTKLDIVIKIQQNAKCKLMILREGENDLDLSCDIDIYKDAYCTMGFLDMENASMKYSSKVSLKETGASFDLLSGQLCQSNNTKDNTIDVIHEAGHTYGEMRNFAVLFDKAHYEMVATGDIKKGCKQAQSHQATRVLTLGKDHTAKVIPLLLIDENDVKASHAQTIGQPDEDQLYYLQSRGLSHHKAIGLLSVGYLLPVLDLIDDEEIKQTLAQQMESKVGLYEHA